MRIGQGFDAHSFKPGGPLVIGGVRIPFEFGLAAHSDGDVLIHAICDALLGAASLGDIGVHFPDSDPAYKGVDSRVLLRRTLEMVHGRGFAVANVDATVIAQRPKMAPHFPQMRQRLCADLGIDEEQLNLKATTTESMGFTGRGEGIAALAIALLVSRQQ